jgi:PleD family two-component response regulator
MRQALSIEPMSLGGATLSLTCSMGAVTAGPGLRLQPEALIRVADEGLYRAKNQGRDRVVYLDHNCQLV